MNTRKFFYGIITCCVLTAAACTSSTAEDDQLYEQGIKKDEIILKNINDKEVEKDNIKIEIYILSHRPKIKPINKLL